MGFNELFLVYNLVKIDPIIPLKIDVGFIVDTSIRIPIANAYIPTDSWLRKYPIITLSTAMSENINKITPSAWLFP